MNNNLVIIKQLPIIEERLSTLKSEIEQKTKIAVAMECTESTVKDIKKIRAELTKEFNEFDERRKDVKAQIEAPYKAFNSVYEDCVALPFKTADKLLKAKIDAIENDLKEQKKEKIVSYAEELKIAYSLEWLDIERVLPNITLSASLSSLKSDVAEKLDKINLDCKCISGDVEVFAEYKKTLNLAQAKLTVEQRKREVEVAKSNIQNTSEQQQIKQEHEQKIEALAPPAVDVKKANIYKMTFTVHGTMTQLKELKNFMNERGISYD